MAFPVRREQARSLGDALARAFELVATPALLGFLGWLLDGWLGTTPVFTIVLAVLALFTTVARMWYGYKWDMAQHEAAGPWAPRPTPTPAAGEVTQP